MTDEQSWTLEEETLFEDLAREGSLTRLEAIRLYLRMKKDIEKCWKYVREAE